MNKLEKLEFILNVALMISMVIASVAHAHKFVVNVNLVHLFFSIMYITASVAIGHCIYIKYQIYKIWMFND